MLKALNFIRYKFDFIKLSVIGVIQNFLIIVIPVIQKNIVNSIIGNKMVKNDIISFLALSFITICLTFIESYMLISLRYKFQKWITLKILGSLSIRDNTIIKTRGSGALMSSVFGDSEQLSTMIFGSNVFSSLFNVISVAVILVITYSWVKFFPLLIIAAYCVCFISLSILRKKQSVYFEKAREEVFKLNPVVLELIENRKTIMQFINFSSFIDDIAEKVDERDKHFKKSMFLAELGQRLIDSVKNTSLVLFFIFSMFLILDKKMQISSFIAIISYFPSLFLPVYVVNSIFNMRSRFKILYAKNRESFESEESYVFPKNSELTIDNISISKGDKTVLQNISFNLDKMYGIVGISGEGKSSLLKVILGEDSPSTGSVNYGNKNIHDVDLYLKQKLFRYYKQENDIFDSDLKYNISLGRKAVSREEYVKKIDKMKSDIEEFKRKAASSNLGSEFLNSYLGKHILNFNNFYTDADRAMNAVSDALLKQDLSTELLSEITMNSEYFIEEDYHNLVKDFGIAHLEGRKLGQRGKYISGGEKNKICLARILLNNANIPFLIDEPFTSIDLISERENLKILKKHITGKRGIIVSHKIELMKTLCDEIIVINDGTVESVGKHSDLLENSKLYRELYEEYLKKSEDFTGKNV